MRFTRRKLLACSLAVGMIALAATANTSMTMIAGCVAHPQHQSTSTAPRTAASWSQPVQHVTVTPSACPSSYRCDLPAPVAIDVPMPEKIKTQFASAPLQPLIPEVRLDLPKPETFEPPMAHPPAPVAAPVVVLPRVEVVMAPPVVEVPALPTALPKVVPVEATDAAPFRKLVVDFSSSPLKFEMASGESTLQVNCDSLDVRMPGEKGTTTTPLKATGNVRFKAPGCMGSCDEMVIYTTTGEVVLHGSVKLRCRQGNVETEVTGTSVKFKLGSASTLQMQSTGAGAMQTITR